MARVLIAGLAGLLSFSWVWACPPPQKLGYEIVRRIRRREPAYTQGLVYYSGWLYESVGQYDRSRVQRIDPSSGRVEVLRRLNKRIFAEGMDFWDGRFVQLTWKEGMLLIWSPEFRAMPAKRRWRGEGWGLTHDPEHWIASDGSSRLRFLDRATLEETGGIEITRGAAPQDNLNELEYFDGRVWANVYKSTEIVRIDTQDGCVDGVLELKRLQPKGKHAGVANGIAWEPGKGLLFVTGKDWPWLYSLRLKTPR